MFPESGTSGSPGQLCWREMRSNGGNVACISVPDSLVSDYTLKLPSTSGATGQFLYLSSTAQLGWYTPIPQPMVPNVERTSTTRLTVGSNCSASTPCLFRFGGEVDGLSAPVTVDVTGGTGTLEIKTSGGGITVYTSGTLAVTCGGACGTTMTQGYHPQDGLLPIYEWNAASGAWDSTGTDLRALLFQQLIIAEGAHMSVSHNASAIEVEADLSATWRFTGVLGVPQAAPGSPSNGDIWYDTSGHKFKCRVNGATVDCDTTGTTGFPHNEVRITDYGAADDCSVAINSAFTSAIAALPTDSGGEKSGIISFPAGCFAVDISAGVPLLISRASGHGDITLSGAGAGNEFAVVGAGTEIKVIGSAPSVDTPIVEFRNTLGGGIRNIQFNADGMAKSRIIYIRESRYGTLFNVTGRRWTSGPGLELSTESGATAGTCYWNIYALNLTDVLDTDDASGILFDGGALGYDACSNYIAGGLVHFSKSGSTSYGVKFRYADNNDLAKVNIYASDCTAFPCESNFGTGRLDGTRPGLLFEQYSGAKDFPKENRYQGAIVVASGYVISGVSGTGGNIVDHIVDDCGPFVGHPSSYGPCFAAGIRNIWGKTSYGYHGRGGVKFPHPDANYPSWTLDQSDTNLNASGRLSFARASIVRAAVTADKNVGLTFSTTDNCSLFVTRGVRSPHAANNSLTSIAVSGGVATATVASHDCTAGNRIRVSEATVDTALNGEYALTSTTSTTLVWTTAAGNGTYTEDGLTVEAAPVPRWVVNPAGILQPVTDGTYSIGNVSFKPLESWAREFKTYTSSTQSNAFQADAQVDLYIDSFGSSRPGLNLRQAGGTYASQSATANDTRIGVIAGWGYTTAPGFAVATRINHYVDTGGANLTGSIRFGLSNAGTVTDTVKLNGYGGVTITGIAFASLPSADNGTLLYCTDCTRTATCAGSGTGAIAERLNGAWSCADAAGSGTVTSVSWTGGIVSIANATTTPAFTIAGTSGGIPYFSSSSAWASSAALTANAVVIGGGAGAAPSTISASTTTTHALFATATAPAFRAIADSDIPDTITASNYCALAGCTMTGAIANATSYGSYSSSAVDHVWQADSGNNNLYIDSANTSSTTRSGLNLRRARGSNSSPSTLVSGDRGAVLAWWIYTSGGYAASSLIDSYADTVSGTSVTSSLRFYTSNASSSATEWLRIQGDGGLQWKTGSKPTCDAAHRGTAFYVAGGGGVKDTFEVCGKDASDVYAWRTIY